MGKYFWKSWKKPFLYLLTGKAHRVCLFQVHTEGPTFFPQLTPEISKLNQRLVNELQGQEANSAFAPGRPSDGFWGSHCPELEDRDCGNDKLPVNPKFVQDLLLQMDPCKSMSPNRIHQVYSKNWLMSLRDFSQLFLNGLGNQEMSTGSWRTSPQFSGKA